MSLRLLVTGGKGMLGQAVGARAAALGHTVHALGRDEADVLDPSSLQRAFAATRPDAVINCAAWTDVDGAETHEADALALNADAAGNVAEAAADTGAFVVHVSTDYVFDGQKDTPWVESDPVGPLSAYGRTKLAGEQAVQSAGGEWAVARTAWLFGAGGGNFVDTMLRVGAERDEVSVVTDQIGCPTWTSHLADGLLEVAERRLEGIHHLAGAGHCSWYDFAVEIFDEAGIDVRVVPTTSEAFVRPAPRPSWSVLASERPNPVTLPPWQQGLAGYLTARAAPANMTQGGSR
ncbi:MAG: dTDP-4-dehydrorhamnose reductase [Solirubrobacteraceae bacterium]|nr:dTDP-4-dehydrorhamnose reductase [Solirubrobacteraceae bacterium]